MTAIELPQAVDRPLILEGDCVEQMRKLPDASVDSVVTDPPYELTSGGKGGFMGKTWDATGIAYSVEMWAEVMRVLKPGGHLLAFGGTRTYHRMAVAIEDAGFEIRDSIAHHSGTGPVFANLEWTYGSGFPKSMNVGKAIDKAAGATREAVGESFAGAASMFNNKFKSQLLHHTAPATDNAAQWEGWGTALKPSHEPIVVARKPLEGTVANNVLTHGTGALNIDGCRVGTETTVTSGRWPANTIITHNHDCDGTCTAGCPAADLDRQSGVVAGHYGGVNIGNCRFSPGSAYGTGGVDYDTTNAVKDSGGASRYFTQANWTDLDSPILYVKKSGKKERNAGMGALEQNHHPTVKPVAILAHLLKLVTPPNGIVLDPFTGSGTTGVAAIQEGFRFIGCELTAEYLPIIEARITHAVTNTGETAAAKKVTPGQSPQPTQQTTTPTAGQTA
jgi:site-specific DNA-methyltransferase (adenine-specific)